MCGDLDGDTALDEELFAWLLANAKSHGAAPAAARQDSVAGEPGSNEYMTAVFRGALTRALTHVDAAPEGARADAIRSQAIVLARLAGFLAGHLPPESDVFRDLVDALMDGNREPQQMAAEERRDHEHHHGPDGDRHHDGHAHDQ
jgi:hypothetical protein